MRKSIIISFVCVVAAFGLTTITLSNHSQNDGGNNASPLDLDNDESSFQEFSEPVGSRVVRNVDLPDFRSSRATDGKALKRDTSLNPPLVDEALVSIESVFNSRIQDLNPESVTSLANIPVKPTSAPTRGDNWVRF